MSDHVVIENDTGDRATVGDDSVGVWELRGWKVVGRAVERGDTRTVTEAQAEDEARAARTAALSAKPPAKATTSNIKPTSKEKI